VNGILVQRATMRLSGNQKHFNFPLINANKKPLLQGGYRPPKRHHHGLSLATVGQCASYENLTY